MGGIAASISALGNGVRDGQVGLIRVSQGGDTIIQKLTWDLDNQRWVSLPLPVALFGDDGGITLGLVKPLSSGGWSYLGGQDGNSPLAQWSLRAGAIPCAGAFYAAGLKLQDRVQGRFSNTSLINFLVAPWFYEYDSADDVVYDNDVGAQGGKTWNGSADVGFQPSSGNLGHGAVLESGQDITQGLFKTTNTYGSDGLGGYSGLTRGAGWDDIKFFTSSSPSGAALGGVPTTAATSPSKKYLYPSFYGNGDSTTTRVAALNYEVRWVSA